MYTLTLLIVLFFSIYLCYSYYYKSLCCVEFSPNQSCLGTSAELLGHIVRESPELVRMAKDGEDKKEDMRERKKRMLGHQ